MSDEARSPEQVAEAVVAEAPDPDWLRSVISELEWRLHASELEWIRAVWGVGEEEIAAAFGVEIEALDDWTRAGVPDEYLDNLAELVAATELLLAYLRRERIPTVVRREVEVLDARSLVGLVKAGRFQEVRKAVVGMFNLRSSQP